MKSRVVPFILAFALIALTTPVWLVAQESHVHHHHYAVVDLGTLGGPNSDFLLGTQVLNNRGTAVGGADTSTLDPNYPNVNPLLGFPGFGIRPFLRHGFKWQKRVLTDLGALPGDNSSYANWVNAEGQAVGASENGSIDPLTGFPEIVAVFWKYARIINLGTLGGNESEAEAVNNRGEVVGFATNGVPDAFPFPFTFVSETLGTQTRAFLWENGIMRDLGTLGGPDAAALFVNERGQVAGQSYTNSTTNASTGFPTLHPFLWVPCDQDDRDSDDGKNDAESSAVKKAKMIDLGTLGGTLAGPNAMNNRGQVVGGSTLAGDVEFHPFLWDRGKLTDLGTLGGTFGNATWINEDRAIVGVSMPPDDSAFLGFLWRNGVLTDLGTVGGDLCSFPRYINSHDQIVGLSNNCNGSFQHAFLWENGGPAIDLDALIPPNSGVQLGDAYNVNERGEITAHAMLPDGDQHAVLLIPCDNRHPGFENCDYDLVDSSTRVKETPRSNSQRRALDRAILPRFPHKTLK
jgi:probable HAF family extracellular repeat protein